MRGMQGKVESLQRGASPCGRAHASKIRRDGDFSSSIHFSVMPSFSAKKTSKCVMLLSIGIMLVKPDVEGLMLSATAHPKPVYKP